MADAARPLIVVTRPREESLLLAPRLEALGYDALVEPMLEIVPLAAELPPLDHYAALAFTSANGARAFADLSSLRERPSYAVGGATAAALASAGFRDVRIGPGDAAGLADLIATELPPSARLLHLSGRAIAQDLALLLAGNGIAVDRVVLYDAQPIDHLSEGFVDALYACTVEFVLFFSARTAEVFGTVASRMGLTERCRSIAALCLSQRVADKAAALPWLRIAVAMEPTEEALLSLLPALGNKWIGGNG